MTYTGESKRTENASICGTLADIIISSFSKCEEIKLIVQNEREHGMQQKSVSAKAGFPLAHKHVQNVKNSR